MTTPKVVREEAPEPLPRRRSRRRRAAPPRRDAPMAMRIRLVLGAALLIALAVVVGQGAVPLRDRADLGGHPRGQHGRCIADPRPPGRQPGAAASVTILLVRSAWWCRSA
jgi:hypothetical protein